MNRNYEDAVAAAQQHLRLLYQCGALPHGIFDVYRASRLKLDWESFDWEQKLDRAKEDWDEFYELRSFCSAQIRYQRMLPQRLCVWVANVIDGYIEPPKRSSGRPKSEKKFHFYLARFVYRIAQEHNLYPTRNSASAANSACDAVSQAIRSLPEARDLKPNSYDALAKIYGEANNSGVFVGLKPVDL